MLLTAGADLEGFGVGGRCGHPLSGIFKIYITGNSLIRLGNDTIKKTCTIFRLYHSKENQNKRCMGHTSGNALQGLVADTGDLIPGSTKYETKTYANCMCIRNNNFSKLRVILQKGKLAGIGKLGFS